MCGICGIAGPHDRADLERMVDVQSHRGPDDRTVTSFEGCGLGFNRLSIIDVKGGRQPIADETGRHSIIFNGEIYNFPELHRELEGLGHTFSTHTDTETILHGYEVWGAKVVEHLRGMFAFAIWDSQEKRLFLARDRLGIKPLYYAKLGPALAFASELKALLSLPGLPRDLDLVAIAEYLGGRYALPPRTPLAAVRRLAPGHTATFKGGELVISPYWKYTLGEASAADEIQVAARILASLQDTIRRMLVSEVPVGFFLSGGLDSSAVLALAAPMMEGTPLTFTGVYDTGDPTISEGGFARLMADEVGSRHREVEVKRKDIPALFARVIWSLDEPLVDPASLPEFALSMATKPHATVILVGEGSDEQFGGYANKWSLLNTQRRIQRSGLAALTRRLPSPDLWRLGKLARGISLLRDAADPSQFYFDSSALLSAEELRGVLSGDEMGRAREAYLAERKAILAEGNGTSSKSLIDPYLVFDTRAVLPSNILLKVDRTTMAASIEARVPYLDETMLAASQSIRGDLKYRPGVEKYILRKAVEPYLPGEIAWRPKQAFRTPIGEWVDELLAPAERLLAGDDGMLSAYVRRQAIHEALGASGPHNRYAAHQVWSFLTLEVWMREYLRGETPQKLGAA